MTILLIHGAGGGGWEFDTWRSRYESKGHTCLTPDLMPGAAGLAETSIQDYEDQLLAFRATNVDILIGASLGGALALRICPQIRPRALILIGTPFAATSEVPSACDEARSIVEWSKSPLEETAKSMWDCSDEAIQHAHARWRDESGKVLRELHSSPTPRNPQCPTLCVIPGKDDDVPPANQLSLAKWANADVMMFADMSHLGPLLSDRAPETADLALKWLETKLSGTTQPNREHF